MSVVNNVFKIDSKINELYDQLFEELVKLTPEELTESSIRSKLLETSSSALALKLFTFCEKVDINLVSKNILEKIQKFELQYNHILSVINKKEEKA